MVEMWYYDILQMKSIVWAFEAQENWILKKIRAGNKPGCVLTDLSRDHSSGIVVTDKL